MSHLTKLYFSFHKFTTEDMYRIGVGKLVRGQHFEQEGKEDNIIMGFRETNIFSGCELATQDSVSTQSNYGLCH
jgi:hypothetical protein